MSDGPVNRGAFDKIVHLLNDQRIAEAEAGCRQALIDAPEDINITALLGAILLKSNRLEEAESLLTKATQLAPEFAKPHEDLGMLYLSRQQAEKAVPCFQKAVELNENESSAWFGLAHALAKTGRKQEAQTAHNKSLELSPARKALTNAVSAHQKKQNKEAKDLCGQVLQHEPNNIHALRLLANIAIEEHRAVEAEGLLRKVVALSPNFHSPARDLGLFLIDRNRPQEAVEMLTKALQLQPSDQDTALTLANLCAIIGRAEAALDTYKRVLAAEPKNQRALMGAGHMLQVLGRVDEAIASYKECIKAHPLIGDAYWSLSAIGSYSLSAQEQDAIDQQLQSGLLDESSEICFLFAAARTAEANGDFDAAWDRYEEANQKQRVLVKHDPLQVEVENDAIIETFSAEFIAEQPSLEASGATPIFVLGMPRSGSTLVEQILASHSAVEGCGELPYITAIAATAGRGHALRLHYPAALTTLTPDQLQAFGDRYQRRALAHRSADKAWFVDKMPTNFQHIGFIKLILPHAKIIDVRKHPLDACVGNFRQLFAKGKNFSYDLQELGEYYLQYERMMNHWDEVLPGQVLHVQYEDLVNNLDGQVHRLLDFCGLPFEAACLEFHKTERPVNTASAGQVRQPVYSDAIGYWKNYESHLAELQEILTKVL